jgi:hypothetical protein
MEARPTDSGPEAVISFFTMVRSIGVLRGVFMGDSWLLEVKLINYLIKYGRFDSRALFCLLQDKLQD